ncbi:DUF202 domain-containing protein [Luteipulveratus halotolerans]|uniref:DUF202 domain-containing protein n=1 Tax=Luteipulveratus halotolerans TaxID=1631356 RepID=A0A0L6CMU6_9MICO|nr:DUF202 domain-containing protein [Luteipulveratus halotolerans]KNX38873.1 hypothetical protein VV01_19815 [Luteipulveratus halotolerans]
MSGPSRAVPDPGMQAERTTLAWRRTALAVAVGSLAALRVGATRSATTAVVLGALGLVWAVSLWWSAHVRAADALVRMRAATGTTCQECDSPDLDGAQGVHIVAAALGTFVVGVGCLAVVLVLAVTR